METFLDKLNDVSRNESYTRASKHPQPMAHDSSCLLLDYEFCKLFKMLEGKNLNRILWYYFIIWYKTIVIVMGVQVIKWYFFSIILEDIPDSNKEL